MAKIKDFVRNNQYTSILLGLLIAVLALFTALKGSSFSKGKPQCMQKESSAFTVPPHFLQFTDIFITPSRKFTDNFRYHIITLCF